MSKLKHQLHEIIFEADTPAGKAFDVALLIAILGSVLIVVLESVESLRAEYGQIFFYLEWIFTVLFTIEYALRLYSIRKPLAYAGSFFGMVDLLSILPTYVSIFFPGSHYLITIRALRLLRVFRIFKLTRYLDASGALSKAMWASRTKITVFLATIMIVVVIMGSAMYFLESGENSGFANIPISIYWAIVTLTTVGYGDIAPVTHAGQFLSAVLMIMGYAIIAVPTGIVTSEMTKQNIQPVSTQACPNCSREGHDYDASHCKYCGSLL